MAKSAQYHRSAVKFNQDIMDYAEFLEFKTEDETVKKWCRTIIRQHKFHLDRHQRALDKLEAGEPEVKTITEAKIVALSLDKEPGPYGGELTVVAPIEEVDGVEVGAEEKYPYPGSEEKQENNA